MFTILLVTVCLVLGCVALHGFTMQSTARFLFLGKQFSFGRVGLMILTAIIAHLIEIVLFQIAYVFIVQSPIHGSVDGAEEIGWGELFYFSAVTYTSLGYGDLTPTGNIRIMATVEALTGLILIAWTASFAFLVMQKYWQEQTSKNDTQE